MTIGELAKAAGVNPQTIRYYEREGLLAKPHRWRDSNYRDFGDDALVRLRFVRSAKDLGFTLREIRDLLDLHLLPAASCDDTAALLDRKIADSDKRLAEMRRARSALVKLRGACRKRKAGHDCPALRAISR